MMQATLDEVRRIVGEPAPGYWAPHARLIAHGVHLQVVQRLLESNLQQIMYEVAGRGISLGIITYPNFPAEGPVNQVLRRMARRHPGVVLVDAAVDLSDRFMDPRRGLMSPDGWHPNAHGYRALAEYVADILATHGVPGFRTGSARRAGSGTPAGRVRRSWEG